MPKHLLRQTGDGKTQCISFDTSKSVSTRATRGNNQARHSSEYITGIEDRVISPCLYGTLRQSRCQDELETRNEEFLSTIVRRGPEMKATKITDFIPYTAIYYLKTAQPLQTQTSTTTQQQYVVSDTRKGTVTFEARTVGRDNMNANTERSPM